ncbi:MULTISPECIES: EAL domain-containing protein [Halomonas]|uniref:EAL domain-containing protein n=1 Tax=Halomonas TaxID=2745 RepID=UPI001865F152|nr:MULTISPECIES: EAL domain-containing protein [Halomonas]
MTQPHHTTLATQHIMDSLTGMTLGMEVFIRLINQQGHTHGPCPVRLKGQWADIDRHVAQTLLSLTQGGFLDYFSGFVSLNLASETLADKAKMDRLLPVYGQLNDALVGGLVVETSESADEFDIERHWQALGRSARFIALDDYGKARSTPERLTRFDWHICKADTPRVLEDTRYSDPLRDHHFVVVENIETRQEARRCLQEGFEAQQGYWHHKPLALPPLIMEGREMVIHVPKTPPLLDATLTGGVYAVD